MRDGPVALGSTTSTVRFVVVMKTSCTVCHVLVPPGSMRDCTVYVLFEAAPKRNSALVWPGFTLTSFSDKPLFASRGFVPALYSCRLVMPSPSASWLASLGSLMLKLYCCSQ